jgi:hypothetical protein
MSDPFRHFYQHNTPDLSFITDTSHRHFRILLPRGIFFKIPHRIRSGAALQQWLVRYRPSDVYYSASCWLVPENLGRRERTPVSDNIFLSSDIVFDIDRSPFSPENLEQARRDTVQLVAFCKEHNLPIRYVAFSGSKGFHVVCADTRRYSNPDPLAREDIAKAVRKTILAKVQACGITVDPKITPDTRRIIRVPGTINSRSGYVCTVLSEEQLEQPAEAMLKYIPRVNTGTPLIPGRGDDRPLRGSRIISWLCHRFGVRSKPIRRFSYATWLTNCVPGTPLQVPFFTYPPHRSLSSVENELCCLQEKYGLSDICLFRSGTGISAVCLRTFSLRRLEKIIGASTSTNHGTLLKYHQLFFRVGDVRDENQKLLENPPSYEKTLPGSEPANGHFVSMPHYRFLEDYQTPLRTYPRMHGQGPVRLTHTITEE